MQLWEYDISIVSWYELHATLNNAGLEGYELVTATDWEEGKVKIILKRPKQYADGE